MHTYPFKFNNVFGIEHMVRWCNIQYKYVTDILHSTENLKNMLKFSIALCMSYMERLCIDEK